MGRARTPDTRSVGTNCRTGRGGIRSLRDLLARGPGNVPVDSSVSRRTEPTDPEESPRNTLHSRLLLRVVAQYRHIGLSRCEAGSAARSAAPDDHAGTARA